jgi:hypothetical protein
VRHIIPATTGWLTETNIPEPATISLLSLGIVVALPRRRK